MYRIEATIGSFCYNAKYCIRRVDFPIVRRSGRAGSVTSRVWFWGVSGERVGDLSSFYLAGVAIPPVPKRKNGASPKSAPSERRNPVRSTGVTSLLDSPIADGGLGEGLGVSPSQKQKMTPGPYLLNGGPYGN